MTQPLFDINRHGAFAAPPSLWVCIAFLLRQWVLIGVVAVAWVSPGVDVAWVFGLLSWPMLLAQAPLLLLVLAGMRRVPQAGAWARALWRHGRTLMSVTAALNIACALWYLAAQEVWSPVPERLVAAMALMDAAILVGVWRSPHYRAVFGDFPDKAALRPRGP